MAVIILPITARFQGIATAGKKDIAFIGRIADILALSNHWKKSSRGWKSVIRRIPMIGMIRSE